MAQRPSHEEIDLSASLGQFRVNWKTTLGLMVFFGVVAIVVTAVIPPAYESKAVLAFPNRGPKDVIGQVPNFLQAEQASEILFVSGLMTSRSSMDHVADTLGVKREEVKENFKVVPALESRQLELAYVTPKAEQGKVALDATLAYIEQVTKEMGMNDSSSRIESLQSRRNEKEKELAGLEDELREFLSSADTVPTPEDEFTGGAYLKSLGDLQFQLDSVRRQIEAQRNVVKNVGEGAEEGLPTGLPQEEQWRAELLKRQAELEAAKAKYQPGQPQVIEAQKQLDATKANLQKEISAYVQSIQKGVDTTMADLLAQEIVLDWQVSEVRKTAMAAPTEAIEFRQLLRQINSVQESLSMIETTEETEILKQRTDAPDWVVLDDPYTNPDPVNKRYLFHAVIAGFIGAMLGMVVFSRRRPGA